MSIVALLLLGSLFAQQDVRAPSPAEVARVRAIYQPGAPHAELAKLVGTWAQDVTFASGTSVIVRRPAVGRIRARRMPHISRTEDQPGQAIGLIPHTTRRSLSWSTDSSSTAKICSLADHRGTDP